MELKLLCDCGQKYAFDVEPINGVMPFVVNCPSCGIDGTDRANQMLTQAKPQAAASFKPAGLRINVPVTLQESHPVEPPPLSALPVPQKVPLVPGSSGRQWEKADMTETHSLVLGGVGAILGAALGVGVMLGFKMVTGFVLPVIGLSIGLLAGFGARWFYKGTDMTLGAIAAVVTFIAAGGLFLFMFGLFAIMSVMVLMITVAIAYKIAG